VDAWALPAPPAPVRFGLRPRPEGARPPGRPLVIAQLTDTHLGAKPLAVGRAHLDEALAIVAAHDPPVDVVLATGDLTASGAPAELSAWRAAVASLGGTPPVLAAMGNHDLTRGPDPGMAYQRACGPWAYEQELAGYRFVVVYQRALDHPSIVWARQRIAASPLPVVLVLHHWPRRALADALVGPNVVAVLSGDWHDAEVRRRPGGAVDVHSAPTLFGGWDHSPAAVRFVQVAPVAGAPAGTPPVVATELRYLRQPEHLAIVLPEAAAAGPAARQVLVQAYDSRAEVRRVTYELAADGAPVQARGSLRRCGTWAWCGTLAAPLPAGAYRLDVRAEAADGRAWTARRRLHVDAAAEPAPVAVAAADGAVPGAAPARVDGAWPTFRGDTARSGHAGPALAPPLRVAWAAAAGGEVYAGGPVAADGVVVLPLMDRATTGARRGGVAAFDLADGQPRWRYRGGSSVRHSPTIVPPAPGGPAARGADGARGLVVFQQTDGATVALDLATGVERWRHDLAAEAPPPFAGYYALAGPLVISERSGAERSGAERSGAERSGPERSGPERGGPERGGPERGGPAGRVYVGPPAAPRVLDLATGTVLAKLPALDGHPAVTHASPLRLGRLVLWPTRNRGLFAFADRPRGGRLREAWRAAGLTLSATPVAAGDEVVALAHDGLYVVDGGRGRVRARFPVPAGASAASPLVADDDVYVPAADGALLALDRRTGAPRWRFETGPALLDFLLYRAEAKGHSSSPLLAGTVLYFGGHDGHVYALDRRDGAVAWSFPVGLPVPSAPALVGDTLLIADHGGVLYAFRPAPGPASAVGGGGPGAGAATP
jgi:outer membrane protein assembly factor BamB